MFWLVYFACIIICLACLKICGNHLYWSLPLSFDESKTCIWIIIVFSLLPIINVILSIIGILYSLVLILIWVGALKGINSITEFFIGGKGK